MKNGNRLTSKAVASEWAGHANLTPEQRDRYATWIWDNAPSVGCRYADHPLHSLTPDEFWGIVG